MIRSDDIARRLAELGCRPEQVQRHMLRGVAPVVIARSPHAPRPQDWLPRSFRVRSADFRARDKGCARLRARPFGFNRQVAGRSMHADLPACAKQFPPGDAFSPQLLACGRRSCRCNERAILRARLAAVVV